MCHKDTEEQIKGSVYEHAKLCQSLKIAQYTLHILCYADIYIYVWEYTTNLAGQSIGLIRCILYYNTLNRLNLDNPRKYTYA